MVKGLSEEAFGSPRALLALGNDENSEDANAAF
jgi:hypothetical protein